MATRVLIIGTGLIGSSIGLALKSLGPSFRGTLLGWDGNADELAKAHEMGAIDEVLPTAAAVLTPGVADIYVLATPVLPILDWMQRLASIVSPGQLVTDVGSTKREIVHLAGTLYNGPSQGAFLATHPMAGKESGGAIHAEAGLFRGAAWLLTPPTSSDDAHVQRWVHWVEAFGSRVFYVDADEHDRVCAWASHLPQMLSTALSASLENAFAKDSDGRLLLHAIGGRALRETTRLGSSPYSMWRDIALTNSDAIAATLYQLEQELAHMRENLKSAELREVFHTANSFRKL